MIILYPTETLYALGVNALSEEAVLGVCSLKGRDASKPASWLVRSMEDVQKYAQVGEVTAGIAERFLPGPLTLILKAKDTVPEFRRGIDDEVSFRISSDPLAQKLIVDYMEEHGAPLTCTSANISGAPTLPTPGEILQQFGPKAKDVTDIIDDGPRKSLATTIIRIVDDEVTVVREGSISEREILECMKEMQS